jgi:hypothetical protein
MAGTFGFYLEQHALDRYFGSTGAFTGSSSLWVGLTSEVITSSGQEFIGKEPSTLTGYTRVHVSNTSSNFTAAETSGGKGVKFNTAAWTFPVVAASSWPEVLYAFISDTSSEAAATGNMLCWGSLTAAKNLDVGDTASFAVSAFKITLD